LPTREVRQGDPTSSGSRVQDRVLAEVSELGPPPWREAHLRQWFLDFSIPLPAANAGPEFMTKRRRAFGLRLRDRRHRAGFTRTELARRAQLSDSTIKFVETARQPLSRKTLMRLLGALVALPIPDWLLRNPLPFTLVADPATQTCRDLRVQWPMVWAPNCSPVLSAPVATRS